jgi:hypothetical protein
MNTVEKIIKLISQKYYPFITVLGNYKKDRSATIHDKNNDTVFTVLENTMYSFKDQNKSYWLTIPENCVLNGQKIYPAVGDVIRCEGIPYSFTTQEAVVEMAANYFEDFIDPHYGFNTVMRGMSFYEDEDDKRDKYFVVFQVFKSRFHEEIEAYISSN